MMVPAVEKINNLVDILITDAPVKNNYFKKHETKEHPNTI